MKPDGSGMEWETLLREWEGVGHQFSAAAPDGCDAAATLASFWAGVVAADASVVVKAQMGRLGLAAEQAAERGRTAEQKLGAAIEQHEQARHAMTRLFVKEMREKS